jgi:hypothetical protein
MKNIDIEIKNAIIDKVQIFIKDNGNLSIFLDLDYGKCQQSFGGYDFQVGINLYNYFGHFIWRLMKIVNVSNLDDLVGKPVRVKCDFSQVYAIGHFLKDEWFDPSVEYMKMI